MALPSSIASRLSLPLIVAPMHGISSPDMVVAACRAGAIGAFPTANTRSIEQLDGWLNRFDSELTAQDAPFCPNLIMASPNLGEDVACLLRHRVEMVITSVGSPKPIIPALHDAGCLVLADVASVRHAERAIEAGADGLILLTAGAGGQTGWANGFAFVRAVRAMFDGIVVLAGGISDGAALFATQALGCDLGYMGTAFIATQESMATPAYRSMLVESSLDDVLLTSAISGLETNMLRPSLVAAGLDPEALSKAAGGDQYKAAFARPAAPGAPGAGDTPKPPRAFRDIWSAGHSVSGVKDILSVSERIARTQAEFETARARTAASWGA